MRVLIIIFLIFLYSCKSSTNSAKSKPKTSTTVNTPSTYIESIQGTWSFCFGSHATLGDYKIRYIIDKNSLIFEQFYYASTNRTCQTPTIYAKGIHTYVKGQGATYYEGAIPIDITFVSPYTMRALSSAPNVLNHITECTGVANPSINTTYIINPNFCVYSPFKQDVFVQGEVLYSEVFVDEAATPIYLNFGYGVEEGGDDGFDGSTVDKRLRSLSAPEFLRE